MTKRYDRETRRSNHRISRRLRKWCHRNNVLSFRLQNDSYETRRQEHDKRSNQKCLWSERLMLKQIKSWVITSTKAHELNCEREENFKEFCDFRSSCQHPKKFRRAKEADRQTPSADEAIEEAAEEAEETKNEAAEEADDTANEEVEERKTRTIKSIEAKIKSRSLKSIKHLRIRLHFTLLMTVLFISWCNALRNRNSDSWSYRRKLRHREWIMLWFI
jgi:flagellar biosynthesis GTPase FlhF